MERELVYFRGSLWNRNLRRVSISVPSTSSAEWKTENKSARIIEKTQPLDIYGKLLVCISRCIENRKGNSVSWAMCKPAIWALVYKKNVHPDAHTHTHTGTSTQVLYAPEYCETYMHAPYTQVRKHIMTPWHALKKCCLPYETKLGWISIFQIPDLAPLPFLVPSSMMHFQA